MSILLELIKHFASDEPYSSHAKLYTCVHESYFQCNKYMIEYDCDMHGCNYLGSDDVGF